MPVVAYAPGKDFPAVSVTGKSCGLDCAHCSGKYLAGMTAAETPESLWRFAKCLAARGGAGLLLSGGCDAQGHVPLDRFLPVVPRIREELGLKVNAHAGICSAKFLDELESARPDAVSVDIVGNDAAVKEVFGLDAGAEPYWATYEGILARGLSAVPHLTVGLRGWGDSGERAALERLAAARPKRLILNFLIPTNGTRYAERRFDGWRALEVIELARESLPGTFIAIGCMRPRGVLNFETAAVELGADGVVNPPRAAVAKWKASGMTVEWRKTCCAMD